MGDCQLKRADDCSAPERNHFDVRSAAPEKSLVKRLLPADARTAATFRHHNAIRKVDRPDVFDLRRRPLRPRREQREDAREQRAATTDNDNTGKPRVSILALVVTQFSFARKTTLATARVHRQEQVEAPRAMVTWGTNTLHTFGGAPAPAGGTPAPAPAGGIFGAAPATSPAPAFGGGAFGAPAPAPSTGTSLFGTSAPAPSGSLFGSTTSTSSLFGNTTPTASAGSSSFFGAPAPAPSAFGAPATTSTQAQLPAQAALQAHMDAF